MKKISLTSLFCLLLLTAFAQTYNKNYVVYRGGPALVLNPLPEWNCIGDCVDGRQCQGFGYAGADAQIDYVHLACDFVGQKIIEENRYTDVYIDHSDGNGCNLNYTTVSAWHSFTVTGVDFNWAGMPSTFCPSMAPVNLTSYFSDNNGTTFSGPGISGTTFHPSSLTPGNYTITASKFFDNGSASRSISVIVPSKGDVANSSYAVCTGGSVSISASAGDVSANSYQWQESSNGGSSWSSLSNIGIYSGVTSTTLTLASVAEWMHGYKYRLLFNYSCGQEVANTTATLSLNALPTITVDPIAATVCENTSAMFSVAATGTSLNHRWQYSATGGVGSFTDISGANSSTYTIASTASIQDGYYQVIVSNPCSPGGIKSQAVQLTVRPITRITSPPVDKSSCLGGIASFTVSATGEGTLSFLWELSTNNGSSFVSLANSSAYSGVLSKTLTVNSISAGMNNSQFRVRINGGCGNDVTSTAVKLIVNPTPIVPSVIAPSRCGNGSLVATATSPALLPVFNWYVNEADAVPVFTGPAYQVSNLIRTISYYVSVSSLGCESPRQAAVFTHHQPQPVSMGSALSLCQGQSPYNLEGDISDPVARGSNFTWTANGTSYTSKIIDPAIGAGSYAVAYDPPASSKVVPHCYVPTTRMVNVVTSGGDGGIVFQHELLANGHTLNLCVGDMPLDLTTIPSVSKGAWNIIEGSGLSYSGNAVVFTPNDNSYTQALPNIFRYSVNVNGCNASKDLEVYVKNNPHAPLITGVPGVVCPGKVLGLAASVSTPGVFTYEWYESGEPLPFATGGNLSYTVSNEETLQVRSINAPFGCRSEATLAHIATPFSSSSIEVSRSVIPTGEYVQFSTDASSSGNSFLWSFGDGASSSEKNPSHYYYEVGDFRVMLSIQSSLGCAQQVSYEPITVWGDTTNGPITGEEKGIEDWVTVSPNPVSDHIKIESARPILSCVLIDLAGRPVATSMVTDEVSSVVHTAHLKAGVYLLRLQTRQGHEQIKIIKRE